MEAARRGSGSWVSPDARPVRRLYTEHDAPLCVVCRLPMVAALGTRAHPCCWPGYSAEAIPTALNASSGNLT